MKEQVALVRPWWHGKEYNEEIFKDVTVLICQRKTKELITLCLESLLNFYPDIKVLVVDGDSQDESTVYLKFKSSLYPNVKIWDRSGINSHGVTMDEAIKSRIQTRYVLLMDSDVITIRGGWIEDLIDIMKAGIYAAGALMLVTRSNYAIGEPKDENDILRYIHPSCGMYDVERYKMLESFADHGAPCVYNMMDAEKKGMEVKYYPVDMYTAHLSGASWSVPKPIWPHGFNVKPTPFLTFIIYSEKSIVMLMNQSVKYFDVVYADNTPTEENVIMHEYGERKVNNTFYKNRMLVTGEYVCEINPEQLILDSNFIVNFVKEVISNPSDEIEINEIKIIRRNKWQQENALR